MTKKFEIEKLVQLARLSLPDDEKAQLEGDLLSILGYIDKLETLDTSNIEPTSQALSLHNVFREDELTEKVSGEECLQLAPAHFKDHYEAPKII